MDEFGAISVMDMWHAIEKYDRLRVGVLDLAVTVRVEGDLSSRTAVGICGVAPGTDFDKGRLILQPTEPLRRAGSASESALVRELNARIAELEAEVVRLKENIGRLMRTWKPIASPDIARTIEGESMPERACKYTKEQP